MAGRVATKPYEQMSRAELLAEIRALQSVVGSDEPLAALVQELSVHRHEILAQDREISRARRALEESRDRYADLFDFAPIGYVTLDSTGVIRELNLAAATLLGAERGRLVGFPLLVHVLEEDRRVFLDHLARCRNRTARPTCRLRLKTRRSETIPVELVSQPFGNAARQDAWLTAIVDLSEHERAAEERRRAEEERDRLVREEHALRAASEAKDRFLAVLSHELRTPLTPILFALRALEARGGLSEDDQRTADMIRRNVELEARLIDDLLDTTRIARGKLHMASEVVDVHELIRDVTAMCRIEVDAARLRITLQPAADEHHVRGDGTRLRQVLWNLLKNAVRHTPAGGTISLRTWNRRERWLCIAVEDTGVGIDPAIAPRLFEPFEQGGEPRRRAGLGLGLAICKGIVDAHGGNISVRNAPGAGARFEVVLSTVPAPASAPQIAKPARAADGKPRLLIVEDHPDSAAAIEEALRMLGYTVTVADSVESALGLPDSGFDIVISDIGLPDGTGHDLMRALRAERPVKGIALSGYGSERDIRKSKEAGFECHLTKPIDVSQLVHAIERVAAGG